MSVGYNIQRTTPAVVEPLFAAFHPYGTVTKLNVYTFAVLEGDRPVAAYTWAPPALGAAQSACPEFSSGVLALTRMVAVPRDQRELNHVSKPLRHQMRRLIDRTRWPVLITYVDYGEGHTGHVYKCSGWKRTGVKRKRPVYQNSEGVRVSDIAGGRRPKDLIKVGTTEIERWDHRMTSGDAWEYSYQNGLRKRQTGRLLRSGNPACEYYNIADERDAQMRLFK